MSTALVMAQVLGGIVLAGALGSVPLLVRAARRRHLATADTPRRPVPGSPAQVWLVRGERVGREIAALLAEHPTWQAVSADADQVIVELRATAGQVAELDHARSLIEDPGLAAAGRLLEAREALLTRMSAAVTGLEQARAEVIELIAAATAPARSGTDATSQLNARLAGLRAGLIEVRGLADPQADSGIDGGPQGHP